MSAHAQHRPHQQVDAGDTGSRRPDSSGGDAETLQERYRLLAKALTDAIWDWDLVHDTIQWNDALGEVFGYGDLSAPVPSQWWVDRVHPDDYARVMASLHDWMQGPRGRWEAEYRFKRADGAYAVVVDRGMVLFDADGRAIRMVGGMSDVTAQREMTVRLRHAQKMEAVGRLAGGVAHDFNNILTAILGYAGLMKLDLAGEGRDVSDLDAIEASADRGARLTRQLLAFGRKQVLNPGLLDPNGAIRSMVELLHRLIPSNIRIVLSFEPGLPAVRIDHGQIEQVILNLAMNAADAMPDGGTLTFATSLVEHEGERRVRLEVTDTGCGMDPDTQARAFEPFFTTKEKQNGMGLGLATVYGAVSQSGGTISLDSRVGGGTTFRVDLPAADGEPDRAVPATQLPGPSHAPRGTILVVEDEPAVRSVIQTVLERAGFSLLVAGDGREGVRVAQDHDGPIDLLLTDMMMPHLTGDQAAAEIRLTRPDMPVILMSGYSERLISGGGAVPGGQLLSKPFTPHELLRVVTEALTADR